MLKNLFESVPEIQLLGITALILFMFLFILILFRVIRTNKHYLKKMSELPLDRPIINGEKDHD